MIGILAGVIVVVVAAIIVTLTVSVTTDVSGKSLPYVTSYHVALPDGEAVMIGNSRIAVMAYNGSVTTDVDGNREQLVEGQTRVVSPRHAKITTLGIPLYDADFQITLKYLGPAGTTDNFDLTVKTSQQVPSFLLDRLMPASVNAVAA